MHGRSWQRQCPQFKDCAERSTPTPVKGCAEREAGWCTIERHFSLPWGGFC